MHVKRILNYCAIVAELLKCFRECSHSMHDEVLYDHKLYRHSRFADLDWSDLKFTKY